MERLNLMLGSISQQLTESVSARVLVIARGEELQEVEAKICRFGNLAVEIHDEDKIVSGIGRYDAAGWIKQQVLKLAAVDYFGEQMNLILDDDVVACQPLDQSILIRNGRALTEWESRSLHPEWWRGSAGVLQTTVDESSPGLSVTPEILVREIVLCLKQELQAICKMDPWQFLLGLKGYWTEYTLYNICAEKHGIMAKWHLFPGEAKERMHAKCSFWSQSQYASWNISDWNSESVRGLFMICQSNVDVEVATLRRQLIEAGVLAIG
jgi:hypothetical protein